MANNYFQFSEVIENLTQNEQAWIKTVLRSTESDEETAALKDALDLSGNLDLDYWPSFGSELKEREEGNVCLWLFSEEGCDEDHICWFIQAFIRKFRPNTVFVMSGAMFCSKLRAGEFGGSWLAISKDKIMGGTTWDAAFEASAELTKALEADKDEKSRGSDL